MIKHFLFLFIPFLMPSLTQAQDVLVVNEVMSMNIDQILDPSFNYGGWIELYNPTDETISLKGAFVTEDPGNLREHRLVNATSIRAKGFYTIWFDHCDRYFPKQVDCKLSTTGGWIAVVSKDGEILAQQQYPAGVQRCSWARKVDGGDEWGYTAQPTQGKTNATSSWATKQLGEPTVDVTGHIFNSSVKVKACWPEGSTLRYTTDGTAPTATNGKTSQDGVFNLTATTNLRLCAIQDGMLPSQVVTNTYLKKQYDFTIPVISVTASQADIYDAHHGIFARGSGNGRPGNGQSSPCNWNQDWDRPCTFEYFAPTGERTFMQDVDISTAGGWSRAWEPHSFKLKAAKKYGLNSMDYPFFDAKPFNKHKTLQIRNGGNDNGCRFKDAAIQTVIQRSGLYVDGQAYQPVAHYINGKYIGVINMREPNNKHHAYSNYGYDTDLLDQFEISPDSGYVQKAGTKDAFNEMMELSKDAAHPETYKKICDEYLDVDEYINYMACWLWLGNSDWMRNNVKAYRSQEEGGRFHYIMFDTDHAFAYSGTQPFTTIANWAKNGATSDYRYDLGNSVHLRFENAELWMNLLQNDLFRKQFVDTYCLVCGSVFEPKRCGEILDELYNRVQPMMQLNWNSAQNTYNSVRGTLTGSRSTTMINALAQYNPFYDETRESVKVGIASNVEAASLLYNGIDIPTGRFSGRAYLPVNVEACAPGGYDFVGWVLGTGSNGKAIFGLGDTWKYYDKGSLDGKDWKSSAYDDSAWSSGKAPLGYDDGTSQKGVGALLTTKNLKKGVTFYFRREFTLDKTPGSGDSFTLDFILDDGCIVYVNGAEAARYNMPSGSASYKTVATTYCAGNPDTGTLTIPARLLKKGKNVIAVEVHNNSTTSSDICWDGGLNAKLVNDPTVEEIISTDPIFDLSQLNSGSELIAVYEEHRPMEGECTAPVRINEVSAMNDTYANEYFKRNDWIELYNTTDDEIDLAGMYLSDNRDKPHKYQIPTQLESGVPTTIPAHGHLLVWCDKLEPQTQLHTNFKLDGDAEACVLLTAADDSWFDYLNYPVHDRNRSAGRHPDGSDNVYLMTTMTPAAKNQLSSYADSYLLEQIPLAVTTPVSNGSLSLNFDGERLSASCMARIEVYTSAGEILMSVPSAMQASLATLPRGIYVARAKANGETAVLKFKR